MFDNGFHYNPSGLNVHKLYICTVMYRYMKTYVLHIFIIFSFCLFVGRLGGAMMLGKLPVPGRPTILD